MMSSTESAEETKEAILNPLKIRERRYKGYLDVSAKKIIMTMYKYEMQENPTMPIESVVRIVANKTEVCKSTVYRIVREYQNTSEMSGPKVNKNRKTFFVLLDDFAKNGIRRKIHRFYLRNDLPTSEKIFREVNHDINLPNFRRTTFYKVLNSLNFKIQRSRKGNMLIDIDDTVVWRRNYLRKIKSYRKEKRRIYYLDETWASSGYTKSEISSYYPVATTWQQFFDTFSTELKKSSSGREKRHIFCIIGSEEGLVPDTFWWLETNEPGNCHEKTDGESFEQWFLKVLPKLEDNSVIVLDNAPYHCRKSEKFPTNIWSKTEIQNWLRLKNIDFAETMLKVELLAIVNEYKEGSNQYYIDEIAERQNKTILRLPPFHCDLSPIEAIWTDLKNHVADNSSVFKFVDIPKMFYEAVTNFPSEKWRSYIQHIEEKIEREMWELDNILESYLEPVIIADNTSNTDSSSSE